MFEILEGRTVFVVGRQGKCWKTLMKADGEACSPEAPEEEPAVSTPPSEGHMVVKRVTVVKRIVRRKKVVVVKSNLEQTNFLHDTRKRIGRDYEGWAEGSLIVTPMKRKKLTVTRRIDDGHAGVVFKAVNKKAETFALKVPKKDTEKQFRKLHQEVVKNKQLADLGLPYADIVEEGGDYLVKRWVEGVRGDDWFMHWNENGRPRDDACWLRLIYLFDSLSAKGTALVNLSADEVYFYLEFLFFFSGVNTLVFCLTITNAGIYVQNLKDLNMIWDGKQWVVIDVGYFKYGMAPQEALGRYYETFDTRWNKPKYNRPKGRYR